MPEEELVGLLAGLPAWVDTIVAHPDTFEVPARWALLGRRLAIENMDARKLGGQTATDLGPLFDALPDAGLCFDIAHAWAVDPTIVMGIGLLGTPEVRRHLLTLNPADREQDRLWAEIRGCGRELDQSLLALLYGPDLASVTRTHMIF